MKYYCWDFVQKLGLRVRLLISLLTRTGSYSVFGLLLVAVEEAVVFVGWVCCSQTNFGIRCVSTIDNLMRRHLARELIHFSLLPKDTTKSILNGLGSSLTIAARVLGSIFQCWKKKRLVEQW